MRKFIFHRNSAKMKASTFVASIYFAFSVRNKPKKRGRNFNLYVNFHEFQVTLVYHIASLLSFKVDIIFIFETVRQNGGPYLCHINIFCFQWKK